MKSFPLRSDLVSLAITETGGQLSDVSFTLEGGRRVSPMHVAPWAEEQLPADTPPIIRVLRGDFFCAPFGSSDLLAEMPFVHGLPASGTWRVTSTGTRSIDAVLDGKVMGATVTKHVELRAGETVVYQRHTMSGGSGRIPVGHHAMLRADHELQLAFSPWTQALTTPEPDEAPPHGRSLLKNNQNIVDLHRALRMDGGTVDLTRFPSPEGYETIWMLVADHAPPFAWTAATCAEDGWVWFALKNQRILPQTLVWFSNGGRDYAPWNGQASPRHRSGGNMRLFPPRARGLDRRQSGRGKREPNGSPADAGCAARRVIYVRPGRRPDRFRCGQGYCRRPRRRQVDRRRWS